MTAPYTDQLLLLIRAHSVPAEILGELDGGYAAALWLIQFPSAAPKSFPPTPVTRKPWPSPLHQHCTVHAQISVEMFYQGTLNSNGSGARGLSLLTAKPNKPGGKLSWHISTLPNERGQNIEILCLIWSGT